MSTERVEVAFAADTADEAISKAKAWARGEGIKVRTVARVDRGQGSMWTVTLAVPAGSVTR